MGYTSASDMAESGFDLDTVLGWHLQSNHYPPVPLSMLDPCKAALEAYWEDESDRLIPLPDPITYKGMDSAPAWAIIQQHHLDAWCEGDDE